MRVVHPSNPSAPAQNFGQVVFFVPPHAVLKPGGHESEESYYVIRGRGVMTLAGKRYDVEPGMFIHLPPWCEHGIENNGDEGLEVLITTSPAHP